MKYITIFITLIFYATASKIFQNSDKQLTSGPRTYSVNITNFSDEYILDAYSSLDKAYLLHSDETNARLKSFSGLFNDLHKVDRGWSVAQGCGNLYVPQWENYLSIKVTEDSSSTQFYVTIYN